MTTKNCASYHSHSRRRKILRCVIYPLIIFFVVGVAIGLTFAILQPSKPRFILQDATVLAFNVSGNPPNLLTSNFQITLSSRNPNDNIGIYYDRLHVYASYHSQQITFSTLIEPTYQGHKEVNVWSPSVGGISVPIAPYNGLFLDQDHTSGAVMLVVHLNGRVRWKVGILIIGKYHLHVRCPAYINLGTNVVKYALTTTCTVSV